ncbi:MAG: cation:proton antiporter [Archaeoglobales archaeon]|nr:cation:proton antiporter [Archaeoglobales archaeon]
MDIWWNATIWFALALIASVISKRIGLSVALVELLVDIFAGNLIHPVVAEWVNFLASFGAVVLTFLAGAELEGDVVRKYWKKSLLLGIVGFIAPFFGTWFVAQNFLGWNLKEAQIAGLALSTTSVAVVYAVMLETGLNEKPLGKLILAACFINDLGTVITLGLLFAELDIFFWIFIISTVAILFVIPKFTEKYFLFVNNHPSEPEVKYLFVVLSFLGFLATAGGSEAVLPAYLIGAALANIFSKNRELVKRLRASTISLLTPFYFLKAGCLVDLNAVFASSSLLLLFFFTKVISKFAGLIPSGVLCRFPSKVNLYNALMMSTGLTFGTISALYGLNNGIISKEQYSVLVVAVILSALIPTIIAQKFFYPRDDSVMLDTKK